MNTATIFLSGLPHLIESIGLSEDKAFVISLIIKGLQGDCAVFGSLILLVFQAILLAWAAGRAGSERWEGGRALPVLCFFMAQLAAGH